MACRYLIGLPGKLIADTVAGTQAWLEGEAPPCDRVVVSDTHLVRSCCLRLSSVGTAKEGDAVRLDRIRLVLDSHFGKWWRPPSSSCSPPALPWQRHFRRCQAMHTPRRVRRCIGVNSNALRTTTSAAKGIAGTRCARPGRPPPLLGRRPPCQALLLGCSIRTRCNADKGRRRPGWSGATPRRSRACAGLQASL